MAVTDLDVGFEDGWYQVDLDEKSGRHWGRSLGEALGTDRAARKSLVADLGALRDSIRRSATPGMTAAVWVSAPETGQVDAFVGFTLNVIDDADGPDEYRALLEADDARSEAGVRFLNVQVWESEIDAGHVVGAYNLIEHQELGEGVKEQKERTVIGVFPPRSKEMVEFVFSAARLDSFDDIIRDTMVIVSSMRLELEAL